MQRYLRSVYWSVANGQKDNVKMWFHFLDSGDALEETFGTLRTNCNGAKGTGDGMDFL